MSEVQPDSPQGIYDTLLELRLQNWAHEKDPQVTLTRAMEALDRRELGTPWSNMCEALGPFPSGE